MTYLCVNELYLHFSIHFRNIIEDLGSLSLLNDYLYSEERHGGEYKVEDVDLIIN